ncbi:MAG: universal stress protein [Bacteroidetes bacterium]|nr:universal stress protein [Bacteroidota bacterium]
MENKNAILVPWDFTKVAESALQHALRVSLIVGNQITLIHITKKKSLNAEAEKKMNEYCDKFKEKYGVRPDVIAREGSIFSTINEVSEEIGANLVIMGTHGIKGMQKLTGSWALKVIVGSKIPFVVVQEDPLTEDTKEHFQDIVFPVDFKMENKEKIRWVNYLAGYYNSKIHMIVPNVTDEGLKKRVSNNLLFAKKMLGEKNIEYSITVAESSSMADETIKFAEKIQADLILIMTTKGIGFKDYVMGAHEQQIIANTAKVPVMCVNPREDLRRYVGFDG